jgi:regulator of cell morphogenesis and NO signaling
MNPATADLFDRLGIDYFCRGNELLGDALEAHNVSLDQFAGEIFRADRDPAEHDWRMASLRTLIGHIVGTHHNYLRRELPALEELVSQMHAQTAGRQPAFLALYRVVHELRRDLELQVQKEEAILFPAIAELERSAASGAAPRLSQFGSVANLSRVMSKDHEKTARALREISALTDHFAILPDGPPRLAVLFERLRVFIADMHRHLHLENNILCPRAIALEKGESYGSL